MIGACAPFPQPRSGSRERSRRYQAVRRVGDREEFLRSPIGHAVTGATYLIWCHAPDLAGSIQWGTPTERDVGEMIAVMDFIHHRAVAPTGCVLMDCRDIESVDGDVLLGFAERARELLVVWSPRIRGQAVVVPRGLAGILLAGALPSLSPTHPIRFVAEVDDAFDFLDHPQARAAYAAATALAAEVRGGSVLVTRLRAAFERDLTSPRVEACAAALGLSVRTLQRELREVGTSFSDEVRRARVATAAELLRLSDLKIDAIAARVGLGTASRLTAALRRELGMTASELRVRARR